VRVPSATLLRLSLGSRPRTKRIRQATILLGIPRTHVAMSSALQRTSLGQLTRGPPITNSTPFETARSPSIMSFTSLPSIPSLYETVKVCSMESEATKSVSAIPKASPKV
jgi:hypothetical protein